jgi:hypothetical protein
MSRLKNAESWTLDDCMEDCHYVSRYCIEQDDETLKCPMGWRQCEDNCRKQFSS